MIKDILVLTLKIVLSLGLFGVLLIPVIFFVNHIGGILGIGLLTIYVCLIMASILVISKYVMDKYDL